jgi:NitT/TauT family transport system substrate-binding protein
MKLRIGHLSTFYHTCLLLIERTKEVSEVLHRTIEWKLYGTGPAIVKAFEENEIDMAYIGLPPVAIGIERGIPVKCIAGGHVEGTVIAGSENLRGFPYIQNIEEFFYSLRSKRIGVPGRGSIHDVIIREYVERLGIMEEIEVINFPWADQIIEAMKKGEVSIAAGTPNLAILIKSYLNGKILWPPDRLWPYAPSYGIVVREELLKEKETLKDFLLLHEGATTFLRERPEEAAEVIARIIGLVEQEIVLETLKVSPRYCAHLPKEYIDSTMELLKAMKRLGYIKREFKEEDIFFTEIIREIHPEEGHY